MAKAKGKRAKRPQVSRDVPAADSPSGSAGPFWTAGVAVVGLVACAVYANALSNGFVWDDPIILERQLVVFDSIGDVLITPRGIPHYSPDYYRPTTTASYLIDRAFGGDQPLPYHFSVILAHAVVSMLVAALCLQLLGGAGPAQSAALIAGTVFALHPVHTESVAWAAGRSDVLATLFVLAALIVLRQPSPSPPRVAISGLFAFVALGAKEVAIVLYPLLLMRDWLDPECGLDRRALRRYSGVAVALVVYVGLRTVAIGDVVGSQPGEASVWSALPSMLWALGAYVRELVWPLPLNAYIDVVPRGVGSIAGLALLVGCAAFAVLRWRAGEWRWVFATLWIPVAIAPSLAILWKIPEVPMAERYAYLPSVGFSLLVAFALDRFAPPREIRPGVFASPRALAIVLPLALASAVAVWQRNPIWHDDIALWSDTVEKTEVSGMAWRSLGAAYLRSGRDAEAEAPLRRALEYRNSPLGLHGIYSNLGTIEMRKQRFAEARALYQKAVDGGAIDPDAIFNLGLSILYDGNQSAAAARESLPHFVTAAELSPHDPDIDAVLGQVYATLGDRDRARRHLQAALDKGVRPETRIGVEQMLRDL